MDYIDIDINELSCEVSCMDYIDFWPIYLKINKNIKIKYFYYINLIIKIIKYNKYLILHPRSFLHYLIIYSHMTPYALIRCDKEKKDNRLRRFCKTNIDIDNTRKILFSENIIKYIYKNGRICKTIKKMLKRSDLTTLKYLMKIYGSDKINYYFNLLFNYNP